MKRVTSLVLPDASAVARSSIMLLMWFLKSLRLDFEMSFVDCFCSAGVIFENVFFLSSISCFVASLTSRFLSGVGLRGGKQVLPAFVRAF